MTSLMMCNWYSSASAYVDIPSAIIFDWYFYSVPSVNAMPYYLVSNISLVCAWPIVSITIPYNRWIISSILLLSVLLSKIIYTISCLLISYSFSLFRLGSTPISSYSFSVDVFRYFLVMPQPYTNFNMSLKYTPWNSSYQSIQKFSLHNLWSSVSINPYILVFICDFI